MENEINTGGGLSGPAHEDALSEQHGDTASLDLPHEGPEGVEETAKKTRSTKRRRKNRHARAREKTAMLLAAEEFEAAFTGALTTLTNNGMLMPVGMDDGSPTGNGVVEDAYPLDPEELGDFLRSRPPIEYLKELGILRDPAETEAKKIALASELTRRLQHRPTEAELLDRHVIHYSMQADPGMMATQDAVAWHQTIDHLSKRLKDRATIDELAKRGIRVIPDSVDTTVGAHELGGVGSLSGGAGSALVSPNSQGRKAAVDELQLKLSHRPSLQELVKSQVIKDVMMWTRVELSTSSLPQARNCHTATLVGKQLVILGGFAHPQASSQPECPAQPILLNMDTTEWHVPPTSSAAGIMPPSRYAHSAVTFSKYAVIFGGYGGGRWLNDVWILDIDECAAPVSAPRRIDASRPASAGVQCCWYLPPIMDTAPPPRAAHSAVRLEDTMIVFGGNDGTGLFNDVWTLRMSEGAFLWSCPKVAGTPPTPRSGHTAVAYGSQVIVFGGGEGWGAACFNDIHVIDCNLRSGSFTWVRPSFTGTPPAARTGHAATVLGEKMFVFGGGDAKKSFNDLHILDLRTMAWSRPSDAGALPSPRAGHSLTTVAPFVILFGGASPDGTCFNDLVVLDTEYRYYGAQKLSAPGSTAPSKDTFSHYPAVADNQSSLVPGRIAVQQSPALGSIGEASTLPSPLFSGSAFRRASPGSSAVTLLSSASRSNPLDGGLAHADLKAVDASVSSPPIQSIQSSMAVAAGAGMETGRESKDPGLPPSTRPKGNRIAEIASNFMGQQRITTPPKPPPGRLGISWPPPPRPSVSGEASSSTLSPATAQCTQPPTSTPITPTLGGMKQGGSGRKFSASDATAAAASGDPIAALSFVRSLLAAQQSEDEARYRQMQLALEDWKVERQHQTAALGRIIDKIIASASGHSDPRLPHTARWDLRRTPTPSSITDSNPSGAVTPDKRW